MSLAASFRTNPSAAGMEGCSSGGMFLNRGPGLLRSRLYLPVRRWLCAETARCRNCCTISTCVKRSRRGEEADAPAREAVEGALAAVEDYVDRLKDRVASKATPVIRLNRSPRLPPPTRRAARTWPARQ